jgi:hypothetical protein
VSGYRSRCAGTAKDVRFGLRVPLIGLAVVLFVIAVFTEERSSDLIALGLAALALGLIVDELGIGRGVGRR